MRRNEDARDYKRRRIFLSIMFGQIADVTHSFNAPLFIVAGVLFAGCLLWLLIDASKPLAETNTINVYKIAEENLVVN